VPFRAILSQFLARHSGAIAVAFSDDEGELVQLVQREGDATDLFELQVLAASAAAWVRETMKISATASEQVRLQISARNHLLVVHGLQDCYYLTAIVERGDCSALVARSLAATARATVREM